MCGFLIGCTTNGGIYSWGILQDALFERGVAPSSTLSYIGSTQVRSKACASAATAELTLGDRTGHLASSVRHSHQPIYRCLRSSELLIARGRTLCHSVRFLQRRVALVGSIVAGLGPILAGSCSTSVPGLIVTEGLLFGTGQALCIISVLLLPSNYFLRRRNLAWVPVSGGGRSNADIVSHAELDSSTREQEWEEPYSRSSPPPS